MLEKTKNFVIGIVGGFFGLVICIWFMLWLLTEAINFWNGIFN